VLHHLQVERDGNRRRLGHAEYPDHSLRGHVCDDGDRLVTVAVEWGPSPTENGRPHIVCMTTRLWPSGAQLTNVVRPWRRGGDWHTAWNETRRQVRDMTGIDIGEPPYQGRRANDEEAESLDVA